MLGDDMAGVQSSFTPESRPADEQILDGFYGLLASSFGGTVLYDLLITDRRVIGIVTETVEGGLAAAVVGELDYRNAKKRHREWKPSDLDKAVAWNPKSFAFAYAEVEEARIKGVLEKAVQIRSGRRRFYLYVPKADVPRLEAILARTVPHATR